MARALDLGVRTVGWRKAEESGERNLKTVFHGDVAGRKIDEEFRNEVRGDFFGALWTVSGFRKTSEN